MSRRSLAALAALAVGLGGCGLGPGKEQRSRGTQLRVTRSFGQDRLGATTVPRVRQGETVMQLLQSTHRVQTTYGGRFVQAIDGISGQGPEGHRDWFYFVNGIEAPVGAADTPLAPGDVVQWDYRRWDATQSVPAIVGAYPEPFVHGSQGKRLPVRIECAALQSAPCAEVRRRLGALGVPVTVGPFASGSGFKSIRVIVGRWALARRVQAAAGLERGPRASGVFARFTGGGRALELLDPGGRPARTAPPGAGLLAATALPDQGPVWLVTGAQDGGVEAAARALDPRLLRDAYAVALTPAGPVRLPVGARGAA